MVIANNTNGNTAFPLPSSKFSSKRTSSYGCGYNFLFTLFVATISFELGMLMHDLSRTNTAGQQSSLDPTLHQYSKNKPLTNVYYSPYRYERRRVPITGPIDNADWLKMFKHLSLNMRHQFTFNGTIMVDDGTPSKLQEKTDEEKMKIIESRGSVQPGQIYDELNRRPDLFGFMRGDEKMIWKKELVSFLIDEVAAGKDISCQDYTESALDVSTVLTLFHVGPKDRLLVGGSISPWIEAVALHHGVGQVVTTDYNEPICDGCHERLMTISMDKVMRLDTPADFSYIISYSSIEHDGLGRYGDPLDPWGDMHAMKEFWSLLKEDGILMLAVPLWSPDQIAQLLARLYGPIRLPWLIQGWEYMGTVNRGHFSTSVPFKGDWTWHPIIILRKRGTSLEPPRVSSCSINCTAHDEEDHLWLSTHKACAASASCGDLKLHFPQLANMKQVQFGDVIQTWEIRASTKY
jgi:Caenorhabditis protein of unknown function, DUF268